MKIVKKIIFIYLLFVIFSINVFANPYKKTQTINGITTIPCTYVAWDQAYSKMGVSLPGWGNAISWYNSAKNAGYEVGSEPKNNSIVVFSGSGGYGHVAFVNSFDSENLYTTEGGRESYKVDEYGNYIQDENGNYIREAYNGTGFCESCKQDRNSSLIIGYIYLDNVPKKIETTKPSTTKTTTTTKAKSNNNYLSNLKISDLDIEFNKETLTYEKEVENNIDKIEISATSEDKLSKIEGLGTFDLNEGENTFNIKVIAENNEERIYTVVITRKYLTTTIEIPIIENTESTNQKKVNKDIIKYIIYILSIIVIIAIIFITTHAMKKRN